MIPLRKTEYFFGASRVAPERDQPNRWRAIKLTGNTERQGEQLKKGQQVQTAWVNSPQADAVAEYYVQGHTVTETANKFDVSKHQVNNLVKKRRLTNGRQWGVLSDGYKEHIRRETEQRLSKRLDALGFDYLGGYIDKHGSIAIKCKVCGDVFERTVEFVNHGNLICRKCEHEKTLIRQAEQRRIQADRTKKIRAEVTKRRQETREAREAEKIAKLLANTFECKVCGKKYTVAEYMESTGSRYQRNSGYCSAECRDTYLKERVKMSHKGRQDSHRHRARKWGCEYDSSVTLAKLIKRDGLRCAICGEMCDQNDHSWSKYCGPMYPSIDHIIPMSKGGGHVWSNVQIAHIICNSEKGDRDESIKR